MAERSPRYPPKGVTDVSARPAGREAIQLRRPVAAGGEKRTQSREIRDEQAIPIQRLDQSLSAKLFHGTGDGLACRADLQCELILRAVEGELDAGGRGQAGTFGIAHDEQSQARRAVAKRQGFSEVEDWKSTRLNSSHAN